MTGAANPGSFPGMPSPILCLGAINVDLKFQVDDLEGFLNDWGTGLTRGGEAAVSREEEARLDGLAGPVRPAGGALRRRHGRQHRLCPGLPGPPGGPGGPGGRRCRRRIFAGESGRGGPVPRGHPGGERPGLHPDRPRKESAPSWWRPIPTTTSRSGTCPGRRWRPRRISISPPLRETALWRCSGPSPAGSRSGSGSAWTRGNSTPGGGGRPWKTSWTTWRPCWSRKPSGGCWGESRRFTPTGPRPW